jgi:uncharacterized cupin superfamily protein
MRKTFMLGGPITAAVLVAAAGGGHLSATPSAGFTATTLSKGRFGNIDVAHHLVRDVEATKRRTDLWLSLQKTKGPSDLYVQSNVWAPGGSTGWHTHPGHSLVTVTAGAVTVYEGDETTCTPTEYTVGMGFVDAGGHHTHLMRNEGAVEARTVAVQLIPADATRRIDAEQPAGCSVF